MSQTPEPSSGGHSTAPAIDTGLLFSRCRGNVSFGLALLGELEATGEQLVDEIARHIVAGDCTAAAVAAHGLKGAAAIIAADPLRSCAAKLESVGTSSDVECLMSLIEDLRQEMKRCLAAIPKIRGRARQAMS